MTSRLKLHEPSSKKGLFAGLRGTRRKELGKGKGSQRPLEACDIVDKLGVAIVLGRRV